MYSAGLPDGLFYPNLGKFWRALDWKIFYGNLEYFTGIWDIL
jgi:hypothetical protein